MDVGDCQFLSEMGLVFASSACACGAVFWGAFSAVESTCTLKPLFIPGMTGKSIGRLGVAMVAVVGGGIASLFAGDTVLGSAVVVSTVCGAASGEEHHVFLRLCNDQKTSNGPRGPQMGHFLPMRGMRGKKPE